MATRLTDLDQYFAPGLQLTVRGREYTVPLPSAELGLWCRRMAEAAGAVHEAATQAEVQAAIDKVQELPSLPGDQTLAQRMLGPTYDEMVADGVPDPYIEFCGQTAYAWVIGGEEAAERYWTSGGRPEALRPDPANRAERRAAAKGTGGSRTAAARSTRSPASTSGTKSRRTSAGSGTAKPSRGARS